MFTLPNSSRKIRPLSSPGEHLPTSVPISHQGTQWGTQTVYYHHHLLRRQHFHTKFPPHSRTPLQSTFPHSLCSNIAVFPPQNHSSVLHHHHSWSKHNLFLPLSNYSLHLPTLPRYSHWSTLQTRRALWWGSRSLADLKVFASSIPETFCGLFDSRSSGNLCALDSKPKGRKLINFRGKLPAILLIFETDVLIPEKRD